MRPVSARGLSSEEAKTRLSQYGPNTIVEKKPRAKLFLLFDQLKSPLVLVLLCASLVTLVLGHFLDTAVILIAVVINTILGFIQEYKAESALFALRGMLTPQAKVIRDGKLCIVPASTVVPGDLVRISAGDRIPADGRVIDAVHLMVDEAVLTGESEPVKKEGGPSKEEEENALVFMGTTVVSGRGVMEVETTGSETKTGSLAKTLEETREEETPLQKELGRMARNLASLVVSLSLLVFLLGIVFGEGLVSMLTTSVAIAVSAIPEGMVIALTVILAVGMQRILRHKALVRKLVAAETLGSVTTICVDKTGTITQGVMRVVEEKLVHPDRALTAAAVANSLEDPLEVALWDWVRAHNHEDPQKIVDREHYLEELPFDESRKYMAVATTSGIWVKGAPEILLEKATLTPAARKKWSSTVSLYARRGLRTLAFAYQRDRKAGRLEEALTDLEFLGVVGIADPVRDGVAEAVTKVRNAGVTVKIVTGDYRETGEAVLAKVGLRVNDPSREIMEGKELSQISDAELSQKIGDVILFSRVTPDQKLRIVSALKSRGDVVAMTGDGVNDALALKKADIGIVVSQASDVARETADMVLLDSNFTTIVTAISEGRGIFENIRKVVLYLLSDVFVEILLIVSTLVFHLPLPLTPLQILWVNLVDDSFPSLALAIDPSGSDLMRRPPRAKEAPIVDRTMKVLIGGISAAVSFLALLVFVWALGKSADLAYARTLAFTILGTSTLIYVFACRNLSDSLWQEGIMRNRWLLVAVFAGFSLQLFAIYHPFGQAAFATYPLGLAEWGIVASVGLVLIGMIEGVKYVGLRKRGVPRPPLV